MKIREFGKVRELNEQLFSVVLGWLVLVIAMALFSFMCGMMYTEAGYNFSIEELSGPTIVNLSLGIIFPVVLAWLQIRQTRKLASMSGMTFVKPKDWGQSQVLEEDVRTIPDYSSSTNAPVEP